MPSPAEPPVRIHPSVAWVGNSMRVAAVIPEDRGAVPIILEGIAAAIWAAIAGAPLTVDELTRRLVEDHVDESVVQDFLGALVERGFAEWVPLDESGRTS